MKKNIDIWKNPSVQKFIRNVGGDPITGTRRKTRKLISQAYDLGWAGPPFNPFKLAELLNIEVFPDQSVLDARIMPSSPGKFQIEYNPNQRASRINFSIAHEIAHTLFPDCRQAIRNRDLGKIDNTQWELEFLCNIVASEILLPYTFFGPDANSIPVDLNHILGLSDRYSASLEAVLLRFTEVVEKPFAMIIASFSSPQKDVLIVDYSKSSKPFNFYVSRGYAIPSHSKAYECLNPGWTSNSYEKWDVFNNNEYSIQSIGLSPLPKHLTGRVGILIIPDISVDDKKPSIIYRSGDATQPMGQGNKIIAQVVNTAAGLGFGFGRAMAKKWPKSSRELKHWKRIPDEFRLGNSHLVQLDEEIYVCQMLAQKGYKPSKGQIPLRYESLESCLVSLAKYAEELAATVHMPRIGAGEAKGNWDIIEGMIYEELVSNGIEVTVYDLPGKRIFKREA